MTVEETGIEEVGLAEVLSLNSFLTLSSISLMIYNYFLACNL